MIAYIQGKVVAHLHNSIVVSVNDGIGYLVHVYESYKYTIDTMIELYIYHQQNEDRVELYGFESIHDRSAIDLLLKVSGVGPKMAAQIVFSLGYEKIMIAVQESDVQQLKVVKGLGEKTAKKILLELKGAQFDINISSEVTNSAFKDQFTDTLLNLGYNKKTIDDKIDALKKQGTWEELNLVDMVKKSLMI